MIDAESINTPIVSAAVAVYKAFWPPSSECQCGSVAVCAPCNWSYQTGRLQARINASGLSNPVPDIATSGSALDIPPGNPLALDKPFFAALKHNDQLDTRALRVAQAVARAGLPVFYLDLDEAIRLTIAGHGQAIRDIALYAPALVYCHYHKPKAEISRLLPRLYSRQYGFCWLVEQEGL